MRRQGKGFSGTVTPLFSTMVGVTLPSGEGPSNPLGPQPTPAQPTEIPTAATSSKQPTIFYQRRHKRVPSTSVAKEPTPQISKISKSTSKRTPKLKKVVHKEGGDHVRRAQTTAATPSVAQESLKGNKTQLTATHDDDSFESLLRGPRCQETMGEESDHARHGGSSIPSYDQPPVGTQQARGEDRYNYTVDELMDYMFTMQEQVNDQLEEIQKLKDMVIRLIQEKKKKRFQVKHKVKTSSGSILKRLKKVGTSQKVLSSSSSSESSEKAVKKGEKEVHSENAATQKEQVEKDVEEDIGGTGEVRLESDQVDVNTAPVEEVGVSTVNTAPVEEVGVSTATIEKVSAVPEVPVTTAKINTGMTEEELSVAEEIADLKRKKEKAEEIARRKAVQASKPKERGVRIGESTTKKSEATILHPQDKGKGILKEPIKEKKKTPAQLQVERDEEIARNLEKELIQEAEREEERKEAELKESKERERSRKYVSMNVKREADRRKFVEYLKRTGKYTGKQLGPMKMSNLFELFEMELNKEKEAKERKRFEIEREVKMAYDRGAKVVDSRNIEKKDGSRELRSKEQHDERQRKRSRPEMSTVNTGESVSTGKPVNTGKPVTTGEPVGTSKRQKSTAHHVPSSKKEVEIKKTQTGGSYGVPEIDDEQLDEAADRTKEQMGQLIIHEKVPHVKPLQVMIPIIDWQDIVMDDKHYYKITRADQGVKFYTSPNPLFKDTSREDLTDMYKIGLRKYGERNDKEFNRNFLLLDHLIMMFDPDQVPEKIVRFTPVKDWILYENNGVYAMRRGDGVTDYYLVEKKYRHGLNVMMQMLNKKLRASGASQMAKDLVWKITRQINEIRDEMKK